MNSTKRRKFCRKVIASQRRTLSSCRNLSVSLGKKKRLMATLLKNNKSLALALQDARCELSVKHRLLENAANHFKNIMQARALMSVMYSDLKSFVKKFDDILPLLNVDSLKISDLVVPFQSCNQFKNKMKKLAESVEEVEEENSFLAMAENINCDSVIRSPNQIISCDNDSSTGFKGMEVTNSCVDQVQTDCETEHSLPVQVCIEETNTFDLKNAADAINHTMPIECCKNSEEAVDSSNEKQASPTNIALKDRESSGTPKLSIPNINILGNFQVPHSFNTPLSIKEPSAHGKNISKILNTPSSSNVRCSKIPRFCELASGTKIKSDSSGNVCTKLNISSQKTLNVPKDSKIVRRKTFVVKNNNTSTISSESNDPINKNEIRNENNFTDEESRQTRSRKTFVIKNVDIPEDKRRSISNRRKTFVKKTTDNTKIRKSLKNRRGTFVISDTKDCANNGDISTVTEISTCNDLVKENSPLPDEGKVSKELPLVCDKLNQITKNAFQENLVNSANPSSSEMISPKNYSKQIPSQRKNSVMGTEKTIPKQEELKLKNDIDVKENLCKSENINKTLSDCESVKSDICVPTLECTQGVAFDNDVTTILKANDNTSPHLRSKKRVSYKLFLESSDSDCESIPDLDFQVIKEPPSRPVPIRKQILESRKKKVFVFNAKGRKSSNSTKVRKSMKKRRGSCVALDTKENCANNENLTTVTKISTFNDLVKKNCLLPISYDCDTNKSNDRSNSEYSEAPYNKQEILQCATGEKDEISESIHSENLKNQVELTVPKSSEIIKKYSSSHFNSPVVVSHSFCNDIECESKDLDCEEKLDSICKTKSKSGKRNSKAGKNSEVKDDPRMNSLMDGNFVKKISKRNTSKKQLKQIIISDVEEEIKSNTPLKHKNQSNESRKKNKVKTSKKKSPTDVPKSNSIIVQAEIHSPPQTFTISKTGRLNRKKKDKAERENCFVVLNDIFQPTNIDILTLSRKDEVISKDKNIPLKSPLSSNSSNILTSVADDYNVKSEESVASNVEEIKHSKRVRKINYSEPSLRKKLRQ